MTVGDDAEVGPLSFDALIELAKSGRLTFSGEAAGVSEADVVWITYDTPVDQDDRADVEFVVTQTARVFPAIRAGALVLVSSQVPVGTTARLERMFAASRPGIPVTFNDAGLTYRGHLSSGPIDLDLAARTDLLSHEAHDSVRQSSISKALRAPPRIVRLGAS